MIGTARIARRGEKVSRVLQSLEGEKAWSGDLQWRQNGFAMREKRTRSGSSRSAVVPTVLRLFRERSERVIASVGGR